MPAVVNVIICTNQARPSTYRRELLRPQRRPVSSCSSFLSSEMFQRAKRRGYLVRKWISKNQPRAVDILCTVFYTGPFADWLLTTGLRMCFRSPLLSVVSPSSSNTLRARFLNLDVPSGKVTIAGDGNKQISFTKGPSSASDHAGPRTVVQRYPQGIYEAKISKKVRVTCVPVSVYDARIAADADDLPALMQKYWATAVPFPKPSTTCTPAGILPRCSTMSRLFEYEEPGLFLKCAA